jgi:DNA-binding transcriptional MocR family regulator
MHLAVTLSEGFSDHEIAASAARAAIWLWPIPRTYVGKRSRQGFILGFAALRREQIPGAVSRLWSVLSSVAH